MSINYCTLASSTVDSFCSPLRAVIFNRLVPILHPSQPIGAAGTPWTDKLAKYMRQRPPEKWEPPQLPTELERIVVEITFNGLRGSDAQDIKPAVELVTITDLNVEPSTVDVNISNITWHANAEPSEP